MPNLHILFSAFAVSSLQAPQNILLHRLHSAVLLFCIYQVTKNTSNEKTSKENYFSYCVATLGLNLMRLLYVPSGIDASAPVSFLSLFFW